MFAILRCLLGVWIVCSFLAQTSAVLCEEITIDGQTLGRTFEGIGALSAGASSRLLIDYPEPQRSQVLDLLFRPKFGAALQHLKLEIGGDINSTCGTEPSHARTREEFEHPRPEFFDRGYEWWLMREAKKRNPGVYLDVLQWGAPNWIGDKCFPDADNPNLLDWESRMQRNRKRFYTQDNALFIAGVIDGAKRYHDVDIDFCGIWNETPYDAPWIISLRRTLDECGHTRVKIVAADEVNNWTFVDVLNTDGTLKEAVDVIGVHYPGNDGGPLHDGPPSSPSAAKDCGKPLWSSEDGPWRGDWVGAGALAKIFNQNYIHGRITKTIIWSLISSYYESLPHPNSGLMKANQPWCGFYELQPALWVVAHTTQFAQPGWQYIDNACGVLQGGGSYVCFRSPETDANYSIVVETIDAKSSQTLSFRITGGLVAGPLHVWRSNQQSQFHRQDDIVPVNATVTIPLEPGCVYSLTTTTGQQKGTSKIAAPLPSDFPFPYRDDFENYQPGKMPKYFSDQGGVFEVDGNPDGGRCLRQTLLQRGIDWPHHPTSEPYTVIGSSKWQNYEVSCDVRVEQSGYAALFGRIANCLQTADPPQGYWLKVDTNGCWELKAFTKTLASGTVSFVADRWHRLALTFIGPKIIASIDGMEVKTIQDATFGDGMVGLGSGWNQTQFDNLSVMPHQ